MPPPLSGKVAIVTGASRGIGAAIARRLAADGAAVVVNYASNAGAAETVVHGIQAAGGRATAVRADLTDVSQIPPLFAAAVKSFQGTHILVNNAGVADNDVPLERITPEHYHKIFDLNVRGALLATREAAAHMTEGGRIINISSSITRAAVPGSSVYSASKAALEMLSKSLAAELGPRGITVNAVLPGLTETDMLRSVFTDEQLQPMIARTPLQRLGTPQDIADVVAFLASDQSRWITGQSISVSGGLG